MIFAGYVRGRFCLLAILLVICGADGDRWMGMFDSRPFRNMPATDGLSLISGLRPWLQRVVVHIRVNLF